MTYFPNKFGTLSTLNSSTLALVSTGTYVGSYEQSYEYNTLTVIVIIGAAEIVTINIDFSIDNTGTNKTTKSIVINGSNNINSQSFSVISKYVRVSILANQATAANGAVQTVYNKTFKPQISNVGEVIFDNSNAFVTKSLIIGKNVSGTYINTGVDALSAVITNATNAVDTRAVITGRALDGTTYNTVGVNPADAVVLNSTQSMNTRSITTGRALDGTTYNTVGMNAANAVVLNSTMSMNTRSILTGRALDGTTYNTIGVDIIDTTILNGGLVLNTRAITTGRALDGTTYNNVGMNAANAAVIDSTQSMNVRGITTGRAFNSNVYNTVSINTASTAIDNSTQSMNTRSVVTGRALDGTTYNTVGINAANATVLDSTMSMNTRSITTGEGTDGVYRTANVDNIYGVSSIANYITKPLDNYNRVQVSQPSIIFSSSMVNDNDSDQWDTSLTGGATANWVLGFPQITMQVTTSGDISIRQQHGYNTFFCGCSVIILMSGTMLQSTAPTNVRARIGYFDQLSSKTVDTTPTGDGFYFQVANVAGVVTNSVVYRYSNIITIPPVTPVQTEVVIDQTNWNIDKLNGTGISGITIDFTRKLTYFISMDRLGTGNVTLGIYYNNIQVPCHQFKFSGDQDNNLNFVASLTRYSLPIRYELQATGTVTGGPATMRQINSSIIVEGPQINKFYQKTYSVTNGLVITSGLRATPVYIPFIAMRLNLSAGTNKTPRVKIQLNNISICNSGLKDTGLYVFYFKSPGANPVTGGTWLNSSSGIVASQFGGAVILGSAVEYNLSGTATSLTGGLLAYCASFGSTDPTFSVNVIDNNLIIQSDIAGNSDYLVLSMCRLGSLTSTYFATISWNEFV